MAKRDPLDHFRDLIDKEEKPPKDYPGGTPPKNRVEKAAPRDPEQPRWDDYPRTYTVQGKEIELFPVGALAMAIGKKPVTIRKWESQRRMPLASYRGPKPSGSQAQGSKAGQRLYSRSQIEMLAQAVRKFKVSGDERDSRTIPEWDKFTEYVRSHWLVD